MTHPAIHPYLSEPVRAAAFAYLVANPNGSTDRWAEALDWTPSKFRRFIAALTKLGLAEIERTTYGSLFRPTQSRPSSGPLPAPIRPSSGSPHLEALGTRSLQLPRCEEKPANGGNAEAMMCIAVANEELVAKFKHQYTPILHDNYGSHRAVQEWLSAGMSLADMSRLLREKAAAFSLTNSGGKFPKSLAYFTRWMLTTWAIERRQIPLPLLTKEPRTPKRERMEKPAALGSLLNHYKPQSEEA